MSEGDKLASNADWAKVGMCEHSAENTVRCFDTVTSLAKPIALRRIQCYTCIDDADDADYDCRLVVRGKRHARHARGARRVEEGGGGH